MEENKNVLWWTYYSFNIGKTKAYSVLEPKMSNRGYPVDNRTWFATKQEAEIEFRKRLISHTSSIISSIKNMALNETLKKRLRKYKANDALEALIKLESLLRSLPELEEK